MSKYEIIIKSDTDQMSIAGFSDIKSSESDALGNRLTDLRKSFKSFSKIGVVALGVSTFKWQASLVGRNSGNAFTQEKIDVAMKVSSQVLGVGTALAMGGLAGGAIAMAFMGFDYLKQYEQFSFDRRMEGYALQEARYRAGPSFNRSRL